MSNPGDLVGSLNAKKYTGLRDMMGPAAPSRRRASCVFPSASAKGDDATHTKQTTIPENDTVPLRVRRSATVTGAKAFLPETASPFDSFSSARKSVEILH